MSLSDRDDVKQNHKNKIKLFIAEHSCIKYSKQNLISSDNTFFTATYFIKILTIKQTGFLYSFIIVFVFLQIKQWTTHAHTIKCLDCYTSYLRSAVNILSL